MTAAVRLRFHGFDAHLYHRIHGSFRELLTKMEKMEKTFELAAEALRSLTDCSAPLGVSVMDLCEDLFWPSAGSV